MAEVAGRLEPVCWGSQSPTVPAVTAPPQGPGLHCPGPLYLFPCHSVVSSFLVKDFGLFYPLLQLALLLMPDSYDSCPWLFLVMLRNSLRILVSSWVLISGHTGQQKIPLVIGETKAELRGQERTKTVKMIKGSEVGGCGPSSPSLRT